ncbi:hypothetical protein W5A_13026 [Imtechella halotolerans K1]|uniref:Uncharacterized protein n=2 Tax=Imtechella TaxID=1165076 RepID=I0W7R5_9FLAO|nr:hypothetical protein W5A_13026 [Imtechella halotolerans K1]
MTSYKPHYSCFSCRKTFKRKLLVDINRDLAYAKEGEEQPFKCPQCGGIMISMGLDFKSPKKEDVRAWSHIESLYEVGITFHSCGCSGPGYIPRDKVALMAFLEEKRSVYIENLRFWLSNEGVKSKETYGSTSKTHSSYLRLLPKEFKTGTKRNPEIDAKQAVNYWTDKVSEIDTFIRKQQHV